MHLSQMQLVCSLDANQVNLDANQVNLDATQINIDANQINFFQIYADELRCSLDVTQLHLRRKLDANQMNLDAIQMNIEEFR